MNPILCRVLAPAFVFLAIGAAQAATPPLSADDFAARAPTLEGRVQLVVAGENGADVVLDVERFDAFTPDATLLLVDPDGTTKPLEQPRDAYFRGWVSGEPASRAFVSVDPAGDLFGIVERGLTRQVLVATPGEAGGGAAAARLVRADSIDDTREFRCEQSQLPLPPPEAAPQPSAVAPAAPAQPEGTLWRARVAIDTDFEFFQRFSSAAAATTYVGNLIGYASTLYVAQVDTELQVNYLRLWNTSADPWAQTSSLCALYEFGKHWNDNFAGQPRTIAHMLSGKGAGGGVAWVGVLCGGAFNVNVNPACPNSGPSGSGNFGGAYGYTGNLTGTFNAASPTAMWDIFATAHEIGHNFNSPHTHCYANLGGNAAHVDQCYSGEGGSCYSGTMALPGPQGQASGTIMSYCHLRTGGFSNIALNLGRNHPFGTAPERVPDRMRAHVQQRAGANASCLAVASDPAPAAPVATAASGVGASGFTANWNQPVRTTNFVLDVSANSNFTSFLPGYQGLVVGAVRSHVVTGLTGGPWFYRVRATNPGGTSPSSNVIQVGSGPPSDLVFGDGFGP
jgi:hypothetical protein